MQPVPARVLLSTHRSAITSQRPPSLPLNAYPHEHPLLGGPGDLLEEVLDHAVGAAGLLGVIVYEGHVVVPAHLNTGEETHLLALLYPDAGVGVHLVGPTLDVADHLPGVAEDEELAQVERRVRRVD